MSTLLHTAVTRFRNDQLDASGLQENPLLFHLSSEELTGGKQIRQDGGWVNLWSALACGRPYKPSVFPASKTQLKT